MKQLPIKKAFLMRQRYFKHAIGNYDLEPRFKLRMPNYLEVDVVRFMHRTSWLLNCLLLTLCPGWGQRTMVSSNIANARGGSDA